MGNSTSDSFSDSLGKFKSSSFQTFEFVLKVTGWGCASVLVGAFAWMMFSLMLNGVGRITVDFLTNEPMNFGRSGGIGTVLVSTAMVIGICLCLAVPLGIFTAMWISEASLKKRRLRFFITRSLDLLAAVPSIVFGLFGMVFFCQSLGMGFSILSGGLTLALMILPIIVTTVYAALQAIPNHLRLNSAALGLSKTTTLWRLLLPAAIPGMMTGTVLGVSRAIAETAALIFTSGYVTRMPESVFDSGRTMSVHIYDLAVNVSGGESSAAATALVLMAALFFFNLIASAIGRIYQNDSASP